MSNAITNTEKEKGLAPKLRFKEFDGEWKTQKLGDVINNKSSKYNPEKI
ncbi:MAG: hypothetical protein IPJ86_14985 [Bacteroidetes bacterium]|nr:hypothetical protein [Bacteroidota bacterium]